MVIFFLPMLEIKLTNEIEQNAGILFRFICRIVDKGNETITSKNIFYFARFVTIMTPTMQG